jgi:glycerophosphoryl diester phosphodiesterase
MIGKHKLISTLIGIFLIVYSAFGSGEKLQGARQKNTGHLLVCHRGANRLAPENTFASAKKAIEFGADYVEIDVRQSKDGVFYILHDATFDRTTNGKGLLSGAYSHYIDTLDAGSWFDHNFKGERVPRLENYLQWIKGKANIYFDVKEVDINALIALVKKFKIEDESIFYFSDLNKEIEFHQIAPNLKLKINISSIAQLDTTVNKYHPAIVEVSPQNINKEMIEVCHQKGLKVLVWAPGNDWDSYRKVQYLNVDMVQVDNPDVYTEI